MPTFPKIDSEMTYEGALNMILTSIAMEELGLSHIINAEAEKLQYVLGTLPKTQCLNPSVQDLLEINKSIHRVMESVLQNQMILKNKMDAALDKLPCIIKPEPEKPICSPKGQILLCGPCMPVCHNGDGLLHFCQCTYQNCSMGWDKRHCSQITLMGGKAYLVNMILILTLLEKIPEPMQIFLLIKINETLHKIPMEELCHTGQIQNRYTISASKMLEAELCLEKSFTLSLYLQTSCAAMITQVSLNIIEL